MMWSVATAAEAASNSTFIPTPKEAAEKQI
jgi:hypothetical protein